MSVRVAEDVAAFLCIEGEVADHLYREGSAKASFWEVLFGARLAAERRTQVSSLPDGTRRFDVPLTSVENAVLARARGWMAAREDPDAFREALAALEAGRLRLSLIGLQARGVAVASFQLRINWVDGSMPSAASIHAFQTWRSADRDALDAILVPFGFRPFLPPSKPD